MMECLFFFLFSAPTIQYRIDWGTASCALMEPVVLIIVGILIVDRALRSGSIELTDSGMVLLLSALISWAFIIRPWSQDWQAGLSDLRDWIVPTFVVFSLLAVEKRGWRRWCAVFLAAVFFQALLGIFQHVTDSTRPFIETEMVHKIGYTFPGEDEQLSFVPFAVGLFAHPNGYAMFLFAGLLMTAGMWSSRRNRAGLLIVGLAIAAGLFWSYARSSIIVAILALTWYVLHRRAVSRRMAVAITGCVAFVAVVIAWWNAASVPDAIFGNLRWRFGLWEAALEVVRANPSVLLLGNGMDRFAQSAYYAQPHNMYIYFLLQYGLLGLIWLGAIFVILWRSGQRALQSGLFRCEPILAGLWLTLMGYFGVGMTESNLMGIEARQNFLMVAVMFIGLQREVSAENSREGASEFVPNFRGSPAHPNVV